MTVKERLQRIERLLKISVQETSLSHMSPDEANQTFTLCLDEVQGALGDMEIQDDRAA